VMLAAAAEAFDTAAASVTPITRNDRTTRLVVRRVLSTMSTPPNRRESRPRVCL